MVLFYQKDAGLGQGIAQGAGAFSNALNQASEYRQQQAQQASQQQQASRLGQLVQSGGLDESILGRLLSEPGGQQLLQSIGPILAPLLKQKEVAQGSQQWLSQNFPQLAPAAPESKDSQMDMLLRNLGISQDETQLSPIQDAQSALSGSPSVSGVPNVPPRADISERSPQTQTQFEPQTGGTLSSLSDEDVVKLAGSPYKQHQDLAKAEMERRKLSNKKTEKQEERAFSVNKPVYDRMNTYRETLPEKELALNRITDAIQSGDINRFTDWAAARVGLDPVRSTQSQILDAAVKELFIGDLKSLPGARLNQFIERNLYNALPGVGKSPEANQEFVESLYTVLDIGKERLKVFDKLSDQYEKAGREPPRNFQKQIDEQLQPYVKKRISDYNKNRDEIKQGKVRSNSASVLRNAQRAVTDRESPPGTKWVLSPSGEIKAIPLDQLKAALANKGRLLDE